MANPTVQVCQKNTWTKIIEDKVTARVHLKVPDPLRQRMPEVWMIVQDTGEAAPTDDPRDVTVPALLMDSTNYPVIDTSSSDTYIYPVDVDIPVTVKT